MSSLQSYSQRPFRSAHPSTGAVMVPLIAGEIQNRFDGFDKSRVDCTTAAVEFYLYQAALAHISKGGGAWGAPLIGPHTEVLDRYVEFGTELATRMFQYLVLITMREARHVKEFWTNVEQGQCAIKFGTKVAAWAQTNQSSSGPGLCIEQFFSTPPKITMLEMVDLEVWQFGDCTWDSTSVGGEPWAHVARALRQFLDGTVTAEGMVDCAFSLEHNNGAIFNKGYGFTRSSSDAMRHVLDVQAHGSIPEAVASDSQFATGVLQIDRLSELLEWLVDRKALPYTAVMPKAAKGAKAKMEANGTITGHMHTKNDNPDGTITVAGGLVIEKEDW